MKFTQTQTDERDTPKRYERIHCFDCKRDLTSKGAVHKHRGHDVHYVNKAGEIDE